MLNKLVVHALIIDNLNRVLLLQRSQDDYMGGLWDFPGGLVDSGEELYNGLHREIKEETSLAVNVGMPLTLETCFYQGNQYITIVFLCRLIGENSFILNEEHAAGHWLLPEEILSHPTVSYVIPALTHAGLILPSKSK
jgi:mutator protein MutT